MKLNITAQHIADGAKNDGDRHPAALALQEMLPEATSVRVTEDDVDVLLEGGMPLYGEWDDSFRSWTNDFNDGKEVEPATFTIELALDADRYQRPKPAEVETPRRSESETAATAPTNGAPQRSESETGATAATNGGLEDPGRPVGRLTPDEQEHTTQVIWDVLALATDKLPRSLRGLFLCAKFERDVFAQSAMADGESESEFLVDIGSLALRRVRALREDAKKKAEESD